MPKCGAGCLSSRCASRPSHQGQKQPAESQKRQARRQRNRCHWNSQTADVEAVRVEVITLRSREDADPTGVLEGRRVGFEREEMTFFLGASEEIAYDQRKPETEIERFAVGGATGEGRSAVAQSIRAVAGIKGEIPETEHLDPVHQKVAVCHVSTA